MELVGRTRCCVELVGRTRCCVELVGRTRCCVELVESRGAMRLPLIELRLMEVERATGRGARLPVMCPPCARHTLRRARQMCTACECVCVCGVRPRGARARGVGNRAWGAVRAALGRSGQWHTVRESAKPQ